MRKLALIILDGWGLGEEKENNAIFKAQTPFFDYLWQNFPRTQLQASGEYVGLPEGQIGGSEVGHLTIGAGRVLFQELPRINRSLYGKSAQHNILNSDIFSKLLELGKTKPIHLVGQISTGGVHSHEDHLFRLLEILKSTGCKEPYIHFISDGRDTPPRSSLQSVEKLLKKMKELQYGKVVTLIGRFYAMDRDKNWNRTQKALDLFISGKSESHYDMSKDFYVNIENAIKKSHEEGITDEFIEPALIDPEYKGIQPEEPLFFTNFRSDRMKQLITKMSEQLPANPIFTMTRYDKEYTFDVLFQKESITNTVGEILSELNLTQLKAAETEKFPHVTNFFNGGVEVIFKGEIRSLAESNKVKHDTMPEMQAEQIAANIKKQVEMDHPDFILVNFANPDMVGHTGNFQAVVTGVQKVDGELKRLCEYLTSKNYICCITADHGNADIMYDLETKEPHTAHTLNPVPFIIYDPHNRQNQLLKLSTKEENGLSTIAGTVLQLMEVQSSKQLFNSLILK